MKKLIKKSVLFLGTVCLCFLGLLCFKPTVEVQAASYYAANTSDLVRYCATNGTHTITLTGNITLGDIVFVRESCHITINGNGYTITQGYPGQNTFQIESGGSLTISNITIDRRSYPNGANMFDVRTGGNLTIESGNFYAGDGTDGQGTEVVKGEGMVTINGGYFYGSRQQFYAVGLYGPYSYVINGGTFTNSTSGVGVNLSHFADEQITQSVTINGGESYGNQNNGITIGCPDTFEDVQIGSTSATINGGKFHDNGLNGISLAYGHASTNIKNVESYNNSVGLGCFDGSATLAGATSNDIRIYNNANYNVGVWSGAVFTGSNANLSNTSYMSNRGLLVKGTTATVNAGMVINNCLDGIFASDYANVTVNGGFISGCTRGIWDYYSTCTINNVEINGNETGVDVDSGATLKMVAGKIVNNTTGMYVEGNANATLAGSSSGAIVIAGNSEDGIKTAHSAILNASNINVYGGGGYNSQPTGVRLNSSSSASVSGNIYSNTTGVYVEKGTVTIGGNLYNNVDGVSVNAGTVTVNGSLYNNTDSGVYITGGTCNVTGGSVYGNENGLWCVGGTLTSKANIYSNSKSGVLVKGANVTVSGGILHNNVDGVMVSAGTATISGTFHSNKDSGVYISGGTCNITSGNIYSNKNGVWCVGGTTTTKANIYNNSVSGAYVSGGICSVTGGNIYGNDTAIWVKGTATISVSKANIYNNGYGLYAEGSGVLNVNGSSAGAINIMGNDDVGIHVRDTATASVSNTNIYGGNSYNAQKDGVVVLTSKSVSLGSNTDIYGNTARGVACESGTVSSTASIKSNGTYGVYVKGGTFTMSGGEVTSNKNYGMYLVGTPKVTVSGGNISSNAGAYGEVYDDITDFTLTGTYGGRSSVNGYVYLAKNDNYVKTVSSSILIKVRPSTYYSGRVVINTSSASYATTQERSTLYPNGSWILKKSGVNVVLARIPSIWYDGKEITGTLNLPSADGWYNANTVTSVGKFTAKDEDKDLTSFVMKYEGQVVASGTKDSSGDMHITYDFKHEGIRTYAFTATDSLGNSVTRTVIVKVDLTPPDIIDIDDTELDYGQSGEEPTFKWSVVVVDPNVPFRQRGEDELSGVANISLMPYSDQTEILKRVYDSPHVISATLSDYPDEKGLVIRVVDKAGNAAYKCLLSYDMLDLKVEPFYPR